MKDEQTEAVQLATSYAGEALVPGGAHLVRGNLKQGGLHLVVGLAARTMFGLPGLALVSANSLVKAQSGRHLTEHLGLTKPKVDEEEAEESTSSTRKSTKS
ncbi:DUF6072 family protein [Alteriqipengyuania lutimaris]|uniref:Uncharacterized protein n=1 Tax=Alteriqipengyuania lutimaris TaxID=1538146 RepID=A0A395LJQ1_9SPHN|nr:DUF6072 family protein [Alteriqipengyuania lutimaris]MBB3033832.1 hypothetical protein [Alteriqipengyuania lutimaris]RDS77198.1 hypothetical protein DL238_05930 [Alteriqipengyuania lutimaris]